MINLLLVLSLAGPQQDSNTSAMILTLSGLHRVYICSKLLHVYWQWLILAWKTYDLKYWRGHMTIYLSHDRLLKLTNYKQAWLLTTGSSCAEQCVERCKEKLTDTVPVITSSQIDLLCWYCFKSLSELCYLDIHRLQMLCTTIHTR